MSTGECNSKGNLAMDWHPIQAGVEILSVVSCYRNRVRPDGPLGLNTEFTVTVLSLITFLHMQKDVLGICDFIGAGCTLY